MLVSQNKYSLNFLISTNQIKNLNQLPNIKKLTLKIFYKKKTINFKIFSFLIFFFLSNKKPRLNENSNFKTLRLILKKKQCFKFLYNFYLLFFKYNNLHISYFNLKIYKKTNVRVFFYTLQNIFFELFFFRMVQFGGWENIIFKLELLFDLNAKKLNISNLTFFFKSFKLL